MSDENSCPEFTNKHIGLLPQEILYMYKTILET